MTASSPEPGKQAVVTGGAGFLGSHLCERLVARGVRVACVDNFITGSPGNVSPLTASPLFTLINGDITEGLDVGGPVEYVFHLASPASPADYLRFPVQALNAGSAGTIHALELARKERARFVLASSSEVYGDPLEHPQPESYWGNVNPIGPRSPYDEAKRFAEATTAAYARTYGVSTAIARVFNSFGPRMRPGDGRAIPTFIRQALAGEPVTVTGSGQQTRSLCYVDDTIDGILALARQSPSRPGQHRQRPRDDRPPDRHPDPRHHRVRLPGPVHPLPADDPSRRRPDISRARDLLGWQPAVKPEEGLQRTVSWFASQHVRLSQPGLADGGSGGA